MKYGTTNNLQEAIKEAYSDKAPKLSADGTHVGVIAELKISARKSSVGIQYWTAEQIAAGVRVNEDRTISSYIQHL